MSSYKKHLGWLVALFTTIGCNIGSDKKDGNTDAPQNLQPARHTVEIARMQFSPAILKVNKGDSIFFENLDIVAHDVTEEKDKAWSSQVLAPGSAWVFIASKSVTYYCSIHPVMKGKIIVD